MTNEPELQDRYQEYTLLCTNGNVTPMPYDAWLEWDEHVYQKHVREAGSVLSPATFQRMQEPDSVKPFDRTTAGSPAHEESQFEQDYPEISDEINSLRSEVELLTEENESLIEDLAKSDAALENQKVDLWKLIEEARESARQQKEYLVSSESIYSKMKQDDQEEINNLRGQLHNLTEENKDLVKQLTMADEQLKNSGGWVIAHKAQEGLHEAEQQIERLQKQNLELHQVIASTSTPTIHEAFIRERAEMQKTITDLRNAHKFVDGQLEMSIDNRNKEVKLLREENELLNQENEELSVNLACLREGLEEPIDPACDLHKMIELFNKCGEAGITVDQAIDRASREVLNIPTNQPLFPHYYRAVPRNTTHVDVYWILKAWEVADPCVQHAIKKLLCAGARGAKSKDKDLKEARDSITRAIELDQTH